MLSGDVFEGSVGRNARRRSGLGTEGQRVMAQRESTRSTPTGLGARCKGNRDDPPSPPAIDVQRVQSGRRRRSGGGIGGEGGEAARGVEDAHEPPTTRTAGRSLVRSSLCAAHRRIIDCGKACFLSVAGARSSPSSHPRIVESSGCPPPPPAPCALTAP
jgi:hypothetical protein